VYADSDGQRYIGYDLMSVSDIRDAVERMQDFGIGTMTVPYNTLQNGKIGIAVLYPVFKGSPGPNPGASNEAGAVFSVLDLETLIGNILTQLDDPCM